jgi:ABC-type polar amino acid transport system ATPase subunit
LPLAGSSSDLAIARRRPAAPATAASKRPILEYHNVSLRYGGFQALDTINESINRGDVIVICGPSGSGKSSLLRCTNGLQPFDDGDIIVDGTSVKTCGNLPLLRSQIGMVFQQFDLYPHMTCVKNLTLAPVKVLGWTRQQANARAEALMRRFDILDQAHKYPAELSGGQQQRVAICRSLILEPKLMMFDEPTSALDPEMIGEVLDVIRGLSVDGMTLLIVTHEMRFAREIAHRIIFMEGGRIIESGSGSAFFENPTNPRTARFLSRILG